MKNDLILAIISSMVVPLRQLHPKATVVFIWLIYLHHVAIPVRNLELCDINIQGSGAGKRKGTKVQIHAI